MKNQLILLLLFLGIFACQSTDNAEEQVVAESNVQPTTETEEPEPDSLLRHVVLFKFKDETSPEDVQQVEEAFSALPGKIPEIYGYEWGTNNSPEGLDQGFTHCFFLTFKSEADRATYLPHPDHKAFGEALGPHLDKVLVVDYWTD